METSRQPLRTLDHDRYVGFTPIGEGGMGVVYLAIDTELNRRVAFKIIRGAATGTGSPLDSPPDATPESARTRFLQEACVTGALEHPGIVPVYELGQTASGMPYYTMRLVRGERTLADAIAAADTLEKRLALLEPFLKTCDAIRYAHSRSVIHRDLKPANIALGEFGEAIVLDWGLAKLTDRPDIAPSAWQQSLRDLRREKDLETRGEALGTPGFMAPEAALGTAEGVDERSDVYSLCAILYVILAGRPPVAAKDYNEFLGKIAAAPAPPHELDPAIPKALSLICLRGLQPDRKDRHPSVDALAADVRTWQTESALDREVRALRLEAEGGLDAAAELAGEPLLRQIDRAAAVATRILGLRPGDAAAQALLDRARTERQRAMGERERAARRRLLKRVALVGAAVAVAATVVVAFLLDARRREAEEARKREAKERSRAEQLAGFMLVDLSEGLRHAGRIDLLERVARKTLAHYENAPELTMHALHTRLAALRVVGDTAEAAGNLPESLRRHEEALALARTTLSRDPGDSILQRDLAHSLRSVGDIRRKTGDLPGAIEHLRAAAEIMERLATEDPADESTAYHLGVTLNMLADVDVDEGRLDAALERNRKAEAVFSRIPDSEAQLASTLGRIGLIQKGTGDDAGSLASHRASRAIYERLVALYPERSDYRRDLVICDENVGDMLVSTGDTAGALASYRAALDSANWLAERNPAHPAWQFEVSVGSDRVGNILLDTGDVGGALKHYERSLEIRKRLVEADPANVQWLSALSIVHLKVGEALSARGDHEAALEHFRKDVEIDRRLLASGGAPAQRALAVSLMWVGEAQQGVGRYDEAASTFEEAERIHARAAAEAPHYLKEHGNWKALLAKARAMARPENADDHLARAYDELGHARYGAAAGFFAEALKEERLRGDLKAAHLYNGACAAALASTTEERRRARALEWLAEDLGRRRGDPSFAAYVAHAHEKDPDLASLRGTPDFEKLFEGVVEAKAGK
jgi:eukaryotic-like serine/threonine-protein kinase